MDINHYQHEIGRVFKNGPVKQGRMREFIQCDVDCVGAEGQTMEAELILLFVEGYRKLGLLAKMKKEMKI